MKSFLSDVFIYEKEQKDGRILKGLRFKFPIYMNGRNVLGVDWDNESTDETVVLLSQLRQKPDDYIDVDIDVAELEGTGMNRHQFCEYIEIPYMTVSDWEHGKKRVPKYFLRLLEYYVKAEQINKAKEEQNNG